MVDTPGKQLAALFFPAGALAPRPLEGRLGRAGTRGALRASWPVTGLQEPSRLAAAGPIATGSATERRFGTAVGSGRAACPAAEGWPGTLGPRRAGWAFIPRLAGSLVESAGRLAAEALLRATIKARPPTPVESRSGCGLVETRRCRAVEAAAPAIGPWAKRRTARAGSIRARPVGAWPIRRWSAGPCAVRAGPEGRALLKARCAFSARTAGSSRTVKI